jgi:hypothetical protein
VLLEPRDRRLVDALSDARRDVNLPAATGFARAHAGLRQPVEHRIRVRHGDKVTVAESPRLRFTLA